MLLAICIVARFSIVGCKGNVISKHELKSVYMELRERYLGILFFDTKAYFTGKKCVAGVIVNWFPNPFAINGEFE